MAATSFDHRASSRSISAAYSSGAPRHRLAAFDREPLSHLVGGEHGIELLLSRSMTASGVPAGASSVDRCTTSSRPGRLRRRGDIRPEARAFQAGHAERAQRPGRLHSVGAGIGANIMEICRREIRDAGPVPL